MTKTKPFRDFILSRGLSLDCLGIQEWALSRIDALHSLTLVEAANVAVLGGDVYVNKNGQFESQYAYWSIEQQADETNMSFVKRSFDESKAYIQRYPEPPEGPPVFVLVIDD